MKDYEVQEKIYEDGIAHRYDIDYHSSLVTKYHDKEFVDYIMENYKKGDRILDLGCGSASIWKELESRVCPDDRLVGVDLSKNMILEAQSKYPGYEFKEGSFFNIPYEDGEFDIVIVSSAFHHILDEDLPEALSEISRVLDEHGRLIGREPLCTNRIGDRGGWLAGAIMNFRHMIFRLTKTREYREENPGPHHHAYDAKDFISIINKQLKVNNIKFKNPISQYLSRLNNKETFDVIKYLNEILEHKEGQEIFYVGHKNYGNSKDIERNIEYALKENKIEDISLFLAHLKVASEKIEKLFVENSRS